MWKKLFKWTSLAFIPILLGFTLYCWHLSTQIEKRFSSRRWSIPSTVYSDTTILYPGQGLNIALFKDKLRQLGYREVFHQPRQKGEVKFSGSAIEIFLNDLEIPSQTRQGFLVKIRYSQNHLKSIKRLDRPVLLPILELEPEEIGKFYGTERERRRLVSIQQVPEHLTYAVLAAEDSRFYEHPGFDPLGILRALYINLRHGSIRQGGSTITQQLAKNYFLTPDRKISRKLNELFLSIVMEFMYEKNEILEIYLNDIYLGQKGSIAINGVGEASFFYFGKPINELSLVEAAAIAGLVKAPNHYSPFIDKFRCQQRRNVVLHAMHAKHWISDKDLQANLQLPVKTVGLADYSQKAPYFMDYLSRQLETLYSPKTLSSHGLSVYTTLDTQVQSAAETALKSGLAQLERTHPDLKRKDTLQQLQGAIIVMQPKTGYVLAMVGGRDYNASQYNRIVQSQRQPGSVFKPFVYLSGLDELTPASKLSNEPRTYIVNGKPWQPQNFSQHDEPSVRMRTALAQSHNLATVDLAMQVGLESIAKQAARFHFSTTIKPYPSLALGAFEVIPMELARAYCVFAADGVLPYPLSLKDVMDEKGNVLKQTHINIERLISPAKSFIMTSMLQSVVTEGTAISLREKFIPETIAGKTGTTNNYRDAWFVGYTPDILILVWVGFDNGDSINATGSTAALPIWAQLMNSIPQYLSQNGFNIPSGVVTRVVCSQSGLLAVDKSCPEPMEEYFLEQHVPGQYCPLHPKVGPLKRLNEILDGIKDFFKRN
jgi:penicillin-binding protein 1B